MLENIKDIVKPSGLHSIQNIDLSIASQITLNNQQHFGHALGGGEAVAATHGLRKNLLFDRHVYSFPDVGEGDAMFSK